MPNVPTGFANCILSLQIPGPGGPANLTFGVEDEAATGSAEGVAINVADTLNNIPGITQALDSDVIIETLTVYFNGGGFDLEVFQITTNLPGTRAGIQAPPQVSILVQKFTGFAGRNNRGRMYLPPISNADIGGDGILTIAAQQSVQAAMANFLNDLATNGVPMHILHTSTVDTPRLVTSVNTLPLVATQRRRLR